MSYIEHMTVKTWRQKKKDWGRGMCKANVVILRYIGSGWVKKRRF